MKFRSKRLLITGGCGFIGSNFIEYLLNKYNDLIIYNIDSLTYAGKIINTEKFKENNRYNFLHGNICDYDFIYHTFKRYSIDGVINFAAESHVDRSIKSPRVFIESNINGVFNLLNIAYKSWMNNPFEYKNEFNDARFHQISTDEVYGSTLVGSFSEESKYSPNSPYSASKASADMLVRSFNKTYGLNTTISISSNNYGDNQDLEKFIPTIITSLNNNAPIPLYGDGLNIRDWIHVSDNCSAIEKIFNQSETGKTYNVGAKNEITNYDLIEMIYLIMRKYKKVSKQIEYISDRAGHDRRYSICTKKINKDLDWKPLIDFKKGLKEYIVSQI